MEVAEQKPIEERPTLEDMQVQAQNGKGAACPVCGCRHFDVPNTWHVDDPTIFAKRQRRCRNCGTPVNTKEIPDG